MITVIITTYRRPLLLEKALESVLAQTYPHFQVCVYDNASGDDTASVVKKYALKDNRVKYHCHPQNIGMMANYKYAYSLINTPLFSFLSDDDFLLPDFLETAYNEIKKYPDAGFVACATKPIGKESHYFEPLSFWSKEGYYPNPSALYEMLTIQKYPIPTCVLFNFNVIKDIQPDWDPAIQLLWDPYYLIQISASHPIVINKKICGNYLVHEEAFSSSFYSNLYHAPEKLQKLIFAYKEILKKIRTNTNIPPLVREKTEKLLLIVFKDLIRHYIRHYITQREFKSFCLSLWIFFKNFGFDWTIIRYCLGLSIRKILKFLQIPQDPVLKIIKKITRKCQNILLKPKKPKSMTNLPPGNH